MRNSITLISLILFFACCGTHNNTPINYKIVNKTGAIIKFNSIADTLLLGDTLSASFVLSNPIALDDGNKVNIKNVTNTGFGYMLKKFDSALTVFNFTPLVVEQNQSSLQTDGRFFFMPFLKPLIGSTIHFVPQDTGVYVLSTERFQYLVCSINESKDNYQINLFPSFNAPSENEYLLERYPAAKIAYAARKTEESAAYHCFYVKKK
jgi:hypothetical protein